MKCSEARELFSAKVDDELPRDRLSRLDTHLANCPDCRPAWVRFRSTVSLLQVLPEESTQPAFVGQVLDRIRGYEAEGRRSLDPMDAALRDSRWSWMAQARGWLGQWVIRPVPAMALGSLVVGVALGSWVNHVSSNGVDATAGTSPVAGVIDGIDVAASGSRSDSALPVWPFADLADEIRARDVETPSIGAQFYSPNWGAGSDWAGQQQVRFENDGARIIF